MGNSLQSNALLDLIFKKSTDEVGRPWFPLADEVSFVIPTGALKYLCSAAK